MLRVFRLNAPLRVPGELRFPGGRVHDVRVLGLPALQRHGDVAASLKGGVLGLSGGLGLDELLVQCQYTAGPRRPLQLAGEVDGRVTNLTARMTLGVNVARATASLDVFKFRNIGNVQVTRLTGVTPPFNWLGVAIINLILQDQADRLRQKLEEEAKKALNESLENTRILITIN
ncbi:uncharacterized protein LOC144112544 [Amblyomma americanum]